MSKKIFVFEIGDLIPKVQKLAFRWNYSILKYVYGLVELAG